MDIARLRTLRELSIRHTMAAVADAMLVSPSAVSQQVAQLELEVGLQLIERRGRGVRLTLAGNRLAAHAERVIAALEHARAELAELKGVIAGELRIAAFPSVAATLIPPTMRELQLAYPELMLVVYEMEPNDGLAALRAWQADVALIDDLTVPAATLEANFESITLIHDALHVLLPKSHRLASARHVRIQDLRDERWVVDGGTGAYSDVLIKACQTAGFDPIINGKCNGFDVVISLVKSECSIAIVPGLLARFRSEICVKKLTPEMPRRISVAFRRREQSHPAISALLAQLQVCAKELC